jgi:hypothetical protein
MEKSYWLSIWTKPRATIAKIVASNPDRGLWWLAAIYGFCSLMNMFQSMMLGNAMGVAGILILGVILAPFWGWLTFTVWSGFVLWVGKWFKGSGSFKAVRASYAWSCVPIVVNVPLWLLMVALFGRQLFLNFPDAHLLPTGLVTLMFVILTVKVVLAVWSLVIYLNALAEVQGFSVIRAILNVVVAGLVLTVVLFVLWWLLSFVGGATAPAAFLIDGTLEMVRKL